MRRSPNSVAPLAGLMADDFIEGDKDFRTGHAPAMVEIFSETKGVDFDAACGRRFETVVDPESGLTALLISRGDL